MKFNAETGTYDYSDEEMNGLLRKLDIAVDHVKMLDRAEGFALRLTAVYAPTSPMREIIIDRIHDKAVFIRKDESRYVMPVRNFIAISNVRLHSPAGGKGAA